jgi:hypothetical protein
MMRVDKGIKLLDKRGLERAVGLSIVVMKDRVEVA